MSKGFALVLLCFFVSLFPLALYFFFLAGLNRRDRPALIPGVWESAALLFGLSGFLLFAVPALLNALYVREVAAVPLEEFNEKTFADSLWRWRLIWGGYFAILLIAAGLLLVARIGRRGICNVDIDLFRDALARTLEELSLSPRSEGRTLWLYPASEMDQVESSAQTPLGMLSFDVFPLFCHVTLTWRAADPSLRRDFETALMANLRHAAPEDNPAAGWFLGLGSLVFGALVMMLALTVFAYLFPRRHG